MCVCVCVCVLQEWINWLVDFKSPMLNSSKAPAILGS